jgi:predicted glycoside hydrolase/deacetylase ChbG (UPF0249 family)
MKIIINGDDLGYSEKENDAIFMCLDKHLITSSTVMSNAPGFEKAVPEILLRQANKSISFGVHLNLTEFSPLTKADVFYDNSLTSPPPTPKRKKKEIIKNGKEKK